MANRRLSKEIRTIHHEVNGIYGHRRIKAELAAMGHACSRHRVLRLMREAGLRVRSCKRWRLVSSIRHALPIAPNHLDRQFALDRANRHWVSDMTYVRMAQGWLYLAVVLDLYSRAVVGWAMHHRMQQALVHAALEMAVARRQPKEEVLLHSDHGSQYCAYDYLALLRRHRIVPSHSRPRNCWATLAAQCGVSPLQASSGKTIRHRLNRGGDRSANNALWTIAQVRMHGDIRTQAYVERRTREGRTTREIHRCLKRYIDIR